MVSRNSSSSKARQAVRQVWWHPTGRGLSALMGIVLVAGALLLFVWFSVHQASPSVTFFQASPTAASTANDPLAAAGITLATPAQGQQPQLTRQQALTLVNQIEPGMAAQAGKVDAQYTLFSYTRPTTSQPVFQDVPVWLVHYAQVSEPPPDSGADSHATREQHDFYVFLDATSGKELLAVWL